MKKINSILRTLCIAALLCMASINASAYEIFNGEIDSGFNGIYVVQQDQTINSIYLHTTQALIILPNARLKVNESFCNYGKIYVFGQLDILSTTNSNNEGTIYSLDGGSIIKPHYAQWSFSPINIEFSKIADTKKRDGKFPVTTTDGWNNYWGKGIKFDDDFYPKVGFFEDEACTKRIDDLEAWKAAHSNVDLGLKIDGTTYDNWEYWDTDEKQGFFYKGNLTLNDGVNYQSATNFITEGDLTYSRTFAATGVWQTWFVPFDVTVDKMKNAGMEVAKIAGVLMNEEEPYIAFAKMTNKDEIVKANTPYVVKANTSSVDMKLVGPDINIRKSTEEELEAQRLTVQSSFETFTFGGNYQPTNGYENQWYTLNTSGVFQKMGNFNLAPQRFWMTIDTRTDTPYYTSPSASAKQIIRMTVLGEDEATGIESVESGQQTVDNSQIYNLQGRKVTSIQSGHIYIMNGKKIHYKIK